MHEIIEYLLADGYPITGFLPDGKIHRFEIEKGDRKAGYYAGHRNYLRRTGEEYYHIIYGSWRTDDIPRHFSTLRGILTPEDRKVQDAQIKKNTREIESVKKEGHAIAAQECQEKWDKLSIDGESEYLKRKKITGIEGIRFDNFNGDAYVPIKDNKGKLWSLQKLPRQGSFKPFHSGSTVSNGFFVLGSLNDDGRIFVAEGFATAASVYLGTSENCVCAFSAGNLSSVSVQLRQLYPNARIFICADDDSLADREDTEKINKGRVCAEKAASKCYGTTLFPRFKNRGIKDKDWNDLHIAEGVEEVTNQLNIEHEILPVPIEQISAFDVINEPYPDENEKTFTRKSTIANVAELMKRLHIVSRYNVISKKEEILFPGKVFSIDNQANATLAHLTSWCERVKIPAGNLSGYITAIADAHPYNPVATWIESEPWDGQSRLRNIYGTIRSKNEPLKETLMRKWFISAVAAVYEPNGVSAHGVLVLQGDQYIGKTKWFKNLCPASLGVIADGMILRPDDKDSVFQVVSKWLVELGELDATFRKSDISQLKAFITKDQDVLRRPYARAESHYARRTVFFASVNETKFLNDPTGNRRFWTVECESIDYDHCINMQQFWAEVRELYLAGEKWILDSVEVAELNEHNQGFLSIDPMEEMVKYGFQWDKSGTFDRWLTATEICKKLGIDHPTPQHTRAIARVLRKLSQESRVRDGYTQFKVPEISLCSDQS